MMVISINKKLRKIKIKDANYHKMSDLFLESVCSRFIISLYFLQAIVFWTSFCLSQSKQVHTSTYASFSHLSPIGGASAKKQQDLLKCCLFEHKILNIPKSASLFVLYPFPNYYISKCFCQVKFFAGLFA